MCQMPSCQQRCSLTLQHRGWCALRSCSLRVSSCASSYWARFRLVALSIGTHTTHQMLVSTTLHAVQRRLYSLVAKMGQVDSEAYPPLKALQGPLKDAPDYITAISSRLQHW
jgi:hypothetical protein